MAPNWRPRIIHSVAVAGVGLTVAGPLPVFLWLVAIFSNLAYGQHLLKSKARANERRSLIIANGLALPALQVVMLLAIWRAEGDLARAFALTACLFGGVFVLLQYYADRRLLTAMLTPYALLLGLMAWSAAAQRGLGAGTLLVLACCVLMVGNFVLIAQRTLSSGKAARRAALGRAAAGESAAAAARQVKDAFMATLNHEIRTPLNGVLGMAQAMAGDELSEPQRARLAIAQQSGEALLTLLTDVLDFSSMEAGDFVLQASPFEPRTLVQNACVTFESLAKGSGLTLEGDFSALTGIYSGDPARVRQILHALLSNALKFTSSGGIGLRARSLSHGLEFEVWDTGPGIRAEHVERLFEGFEQLDGSATRRHGGAGLGLALSRQLARKMGGDITFVSRPGQGALFKVWLPLVLLQALAPGEPVGEVPGARPFLRVLVAEDNAVNQMVLRAILGEFNFEVHVVEDGAAAVSAWEADNWDLVLMDIQMPVMDGVSAATAIRARESQTGRARTPIIAVTADVMRDQLTRYQAAGMDGTVAKPIVPELLLEAIERASDPGPVTNSDAPVAPDFGAAAS
jgi:signal transduction histidine kinase